MQRLVIASGLSGFFLFIAACGTSEPPPPKYAPDRTAKGWQRNTKITTCRWLPPLPTDREDPCTHMNQEAELNITEREDMREESMRRQSHTCVCD